MLPHGVDGYDRISWLHSLNFPPCSHHARAAAWQAAEQQQRLEEQAAHVERLQAARLSAEAELLHTRDEVDSLHAALRCACR